jgi:hypothetical protein
MNVLNRAVLEVKIGDRPYHMEMAQDAPLAEVGQALAMMSEFVAQKIREHQEAQQSKEEKSE